MDAVKYVTDYLVHGVDIPLGWLLSLPRDVALLLFALGTAMVMTLARRAVTNQDLLHRCTADLVQLKSLIRKARVAHDNVGLARLKATIGQIKGMRLVADLRVLIFVLLPIAILAVWASERFDFFPPRVGDDLVVSADFPVSSIDHLAHMVPTPYLGLKSAAIQLIRSNSQAPLRGRAEWIVHPIEAGQYAITIRHQGETGIHQVVAGRATYIAPVQPQEGERLLRTEVALKRYLPFGSELGSQWIGLPPWMIAYLMLTLILVPTLKRLLHVA